MGFREPQTPGLGGLQELTASESTFLQNISGLSYAQGDILYFDGTNLNRLAAGTSGNFLKTQGAGANPTWASAGGTGTVTSVSVTTANGVSGSVATATTTPAITLTLGAITPSTVNGLTFVAASVGFTIAGGTSSKTATIAGNFTTAHGDDLTLTTTGSTNVTLPTSGTLVNTAVTTLSSLVSIGTITTGTWTATVIGAAYGGTGVANNAASTLTISGNFATTLTVSGTTGVTLPTAGTLATLAGSETLSSKTLTAAKIANAGFLADANGNELIIFTTTASAVNEITYANAATGNNPSITASGGDSNVGLVLSGKGTRGVIMNNAMTEKVVAVSDGAGAVIDCSTGNVFTWSAAADRTAGTTTNPTAGQKMIIAFTASAGARTLTLPVATTGDFAFGSDITALTQTVSGKTDYIGCIYSGAASRWHVVAYVKGY